MATKERAGGRLLRFPRRDQVNVSRRAFLGLAEAGVGFLLGAVLAGAEIFGLYAPFGVAAVAAAGSGLSGFCTLAGTCLGYLCLEGLTDGMRYAASAILTYSVAFAFYDTKAYRRVWFMPAIAMLLCALTGIVTRGGQGWHGEDMVYFVTEVLFTGVAAYGYRVVFTQWPETLDGLHALSPRQTIGLLLLGSTLLMSLARVEILATFSLGRLVAAVGILWAARRGVTGGGLLGACAGVALDLASGEQPYYSLVFTLAGLLCGLCRDRRKGWAALVYVLACSVAVLWSWDGGRHMGLPLEALVGAILFLVLPLRLPQGASAAPMPAQNPDWEAGRQALSRKVEEMAGAFHTLYGSVKETLRPEDRNTENPAEIFTRAADKVCARCVLGDTCWQKEYQDTRAALNDATQPMLARGRALATDFSGTFSNRCVHFPEFLGEVNRQLTAFLRRRQALRRTFETRSALCSQYARLDKLLRTASAELAAGLTPDLPRQEKLEGFLRSMNLTGGVVYYDKEGHLRVEVPAPGSPPGTLRGPGNPPPGGGDGRGPAVLCPGGTLPGPGQSGRGPPAGGEGQRGHRPVVPPGGWAALPPPVRRHGLRSGGQAGERPGSQAAGKLPPGRDGRSGGSGDRLLRPGPPGRGRGKHHHRPAVGGPVHRQVRRPQAGGGPHLRPPG